MSVYREEPRAQRRYAYRPLDKIKIPKRPRDPVLVAMANKLKSPGARALYRRRTRTLEPVVGVIKVVLGFGQFLVWGMQKVSGEWTLVWLAYNLRRLHRLGAGLGLAAKG